jgi:hypothetical protein
MVTAALWDQVEALPLRDRIELRARLDNTIPDPPDLPEVPSAWDDLAASLQASRQQVAEQPGTVMTVPETMAKLRARRSG